MVPALQALTLKRGHTQVQCDTMIRLTGTRLELGGVSEARRVHEAAEARAKAAFPFHGPVSWTEQEAAGILYKGAVKT